MWIDSHCHLNDEAFQADFGAAIARAAAAGVDQLVVVGCDLPSTVQAVAMAQQYAGVWAAVGIHPHDAKCWDRAAAERITALLTEPKVVALGEIGLDYHYNYSTKEEQLLAFRAQMALARTTGKPVIIHNRDAHQDTLTVLKEQPLGPAGGVMHCYTGSGEMAAEFIKCGLYISFAGPITFSNAARLREVAAQVPMERILIETDSPYLTPHPFRGQRNEPAYARLVGEKLAEIKGLPVAEVMRQTAANTRKLFGIA